MKKRTYKKLYTDTLSKICIRFTRSVIEEAMPEEMDLGWETVTEKDRQIKSGERTWNACRAQLKENIERILKDNEKEV